MTYETIHVEEITVPENRLRDLRDYRPLAESMEEVGLLQPITVTESRTLVAGRHRLEAAKSLGWGTIEAFVVPEDSLKNRLSEIDENLRRLDLTVYEQSKHAEERERVLEAMGRRRSAGRHPNPVTVTELNEEPETKTTSNIASESGMSESSWQRRTKIGRSLGDKTRAVLDRADPTEEKHRAFLNSTTQLNHLADISNKRGDSRAAETAERVLNGEFKSTFEAYPEVKGQQKPDSSSEPTVGEILGDEAISDWSLSWDAPPESKEYRNIIKWVVRLSDLDPEKIASYCKDSYEADRDLEYVEKLEKLAADFRKAFEKRRKELKPGNLRVVGQ